jgi:RimJ/RimL family protein N-acetyltransferase
MYLPEELHAEQCALRPWRADEREPLARHANNRRIWRNLWDGFPSPYTLADAAHWLQGNAGVPPTKGAYAISVEGEAVGTVALHARTDVERLSAEIGYWLAEPLWGRGIATSAVRAVTQAAFDTLPLVCIFAPVFSWNRASMRVLEKAGYGREGVLRRGIVKDGVVLDRVLYAITRNTELPYQPFVEA